MKFYDDVYDDQILGVANDIMNQTEDLYEAIDDGDQWHTAILLLETEVNLAHLRRLLKLPKLPIQ